VSSGPAVVIIGADREPCTTLASDLRRLGYRPELIPWPAEELRWQGPRPVAALVDLRVLGADAPHALRAARHSRGLGRVPLIAVVPEQEAPVVDLSLGFDDLLLSPYRITEVAARIRLARRRTESEHADSLTRIGRLALNHVTYQVAVDDRPIDLTLKEYQLLLFLTRHPNRVFTREDLLYHVWGDDYFGGTRTVDVHIRRLRAKTEDAGDLIETVRGVGYSLAAPQ